MGLKDEIIPYRDENFMVGPSRMCGRGSSDNGPMFESEYIILLKQNGEFQIEDGFDYAKRIRKCCRLAGLLSRTPGGTGQEAPDDYHGVLAACSVIGLSDLGEEFLDYGWENFGFYNNTTDIKRKFSLDAFMWRMPSVISLCHAAASKIRPLGVVSNLFTALVIATSCIHTDVRDADARRLSWLVVMGMEKHSFLCGLAAKLWWKRLRKDYGDRGMRAVANLYYQDNHPFIYYHKNDWEK